MTHPVPPHSLNPSSFAQLCGSNDPLMIFIDDNYSVEELIAFAKKFPLNAKRSQVIIQGEEELEQNICSPQLPPYKEWKPEKSHDAQQTQDLGLLESGALDQALDKEVRAQIIERINQEEHEKALRNKAQTQEINPYPLGTYLTVRREEAGTEHEHFCLVELNLHRFAQDHGTKPHNVVILLPQSIEGIPLKSICSGAFRRLMTNGIDIKLIAVPEGVQEIKTAAFAGSCVRNISLPASVSSVGSLEFTVNKRAEIAPSISIYVDEDNNYFASLDGSLYSKDISELVFYAWPFPTSIVLPETLVSIRPGAFVSGAPGPEIIICPESLTSVKSKPSPDRLWNPDTLWACPEDSALARQLNSLRPLTINPGYIQEEGLYYDIQANGDAWLVRSPRQVDRLIIPDNVQGHPVTHIRESALPRRIQALMLPSSLISIGKNNFCTGLRELKLPENLRILEESNFRSRALTGLLRIPESLEYIGTGALEAALIHFDKVDATVQVSPNLQLSCFTGYPLNPNTCPVPFDFEAYDAYLLSNNHVPSWIQAYILRLASPYLLREETKQALMLALKSKLVEVRRYLVEHATVQMLKSLVDQEFLAENLLDTLIEDMRKAHKIDLVLFLMEQKQSCSKQQQRRRARFEL